MNRVRLPLALLVAGSLLAPGAAFSQATDAPEALTVATATTPAAPTSVAERIGPTASYAALLAPMHASAPFALVGTPQQVEVDVDDGDDAGVPFMVAGGILFVAGAIAGGDAGTVLMLGGAAAGAYGAFVYFGGD